MFNDAVLNQAHLPGVFGAVPAHRIERRAAGDPAREAGAAAGQQAFRTHLERLADTERLRRIVMAHGDILDDAPRIGCGRFAATV